MKIKLKYIASAAFALTLLLTAGDAKAQNEGPIVLDPLFEYPIAPDELVSLTDRSNWLMRHFWDSFDFKSKATVDQNALNHAFAVYIAPMPYADLKEVQESTAQLLKKIQKNPALLTQFTKAAEEALYGQRAKVWIDAVYMDYLKAYLGNKKIKDIRKVRYRRQLELLQNSQAGQRAKNFNFTKADGSAANYHPVSTPTVIEFGNPGCDDCRMSRLKMESDAKFSSMVEKGLVNVLFIIPDAEEGWQKDVANYPQKWSVGTSDEVADIYDIRLSPTFYVIGKDGNIVAKNISVDKAMSLAISQVEESESK